MGAKLCFGLLGVNLNGGQPLAAMLRGEVGSGINVRIMSVEKNKAVFVSQTCLPVVSNLRPG